MAKPAIRERQARALVIMLVFMLSLAACASAPQLAPAAPMSLEEMIAMRRSMEDALIEGHLYLAIEKFELLRQRLDSESLGPAERHEAEQLKILEWKARVALEYEGLNLELGGAFLGDGGSSTAIIDGETYKEGDALSSDLSLLEIGPEWLKFLYKGVEILEKPKTAPVRLTRKIPAKRYMEDALALAPLQRALAEYDAKFSSMLDSLGRGPGAPSYRSALQWLKRQSNDPAGLHEAERKKTLARNARLELEFRKLKLSLLGYTVIKDGTSTVIINSKSYSEGDALSADLFVQEISVDWIKFRYKGVEILHRTRPVYALPPR